MSLDKKQILDKLMGYKGFSKKTNFAKFLGIKPQVLSNWYSRNSFDESILMRKIPEINHEWLFSGEGSMVLNEVELNNGREVTLDQFLKIISDKDREMLIEASEKMLEVQKTLLHGQKRINEIVKKVNNYLEGKNSTFPEVEIMNKQKKLFDDYVEKKENTFLFAKIMHQKLKKENQTDGATE